MENILFVCRKHRFSLRHYDTASMLFCVYNVFLRGEVEISDVERILMSFAPFVLASTAVATPSALMVRRNESMSPSLTVLPFSKASITSYCKASNTAFTSALDTVERFSIRFTICASITGVVGAACG